MPNDKLSPVRELYLMTNMMNGFALASEEALEVWSEIHRLRALPVPEILKEAESRTATGAGPIDMLLTEREFVTRKM